MNDLVATAAGRDLPVSMTATATATRIVVDGAARMDDENEVFGQRFAGVCWLYLPLVLRQ